MEGHPSGLWPAQAISVTPPRAPVSRVCKRYELRSDVCLHLLTVDPAGTVSDAIIVEPATGDVMLTVIIPTPSPGDYKFVLVDSEHLAFVRQICHSDLLLAAVGALSGSVVRLPVVPEVSCWSSSSPAGITQSETCRMRCAEPPPAPRRLHKLPSAWECFG